MSRRTLRVALVSETYPPEVNGVAMTLGRLAGGLVARLTDPDGYIVEAIAGQKVAFEPLAIPAVVFTDPELAWCGLTEGDAQKQGRAVTVARFPGPQPSRTIGIVWRRTTPLAPALAALVALSAPAPAEAQQGVTPMAERVAVVGLLNKRNGIVRNLTLKPGQSVRVKDATVRLLACETTAPWEEQRLTGAFVQLDVRNPQAGISGNLIEDERMLGSLDIGFGYQDPKFGGTVGSTSPYHQDIMIASPRVELDGVVLCEGNKLNPELGFEKM